MMMGIKKEIFKYKVKLIHLMLFIKDEKVYLEWLDKHPNGYVINIYSNKSPNYSVLHKATCYTIKSKNMGRPGGFTERQYAKICGKTEKEAEESLFKEIKTKIKKRCSVCDA